MNTHPMSDKENSQRNVIVIGIVRSHRLLSAPLPLSDMVAVHLVAVEALGEGTDSND